MKSGEKHCGGSYLPWGIEQEYINSEPIVIPNPLCAGCDYIQACAFRVNYLLEYGKEMPEEDIEIIKNIVHGTQVVGETILTTKIN